MFSSIHKKLYSRRNNSYFVLAAGLFILLIMAIFFTSPTSIWVEIMAVGLISGGLYFLMKGFFNSTKWTWIVPTGLLGFLMMSRWGILDYLLAGLWIAVLILISLFN